MMQEGFFFTMQSPLGLIRVSGTASCISEIAFVEEATSEQASEWLPGHFNLCRKELESYFTGTLRGFTIPISQNGTVFQQRIWNELLSIPFGKTCSYADLAKKSGDPKNSRAVGHANGKNKIAIAVPCHRVIGQNGTLTGYAGGLWRKEWLIQHEARIAHGVLELF